MNSDRKMHLSNWLAANGFAGQLLPLAGDASFRRYFRLKKGNDTFIVMDAPPELEDCRLFSKIATLLRQQHLQVPQILLSDFDDGFLVLTDFGDRLLVNELTTHNATELYGKALNNLAHLQASPTNELAAFTAQHMINELQLFKEWFLEKHLQLRLHEQTQSMLITFFDFLTRTAASQPQVFMHRDYHSANLMVLADNSLGILDFQDAFLGPVTYDAVSLLRDCYIQWPKESVKEWALSYLQLLELDATSDTFLRWFDLMGLQRHLKALLTFARKYHRDNNSQYLQHIPRTMQYIADTLPLYPECRAFQNYFEQEIVPKFHQVTATCAR